MDGPPPAGRGRRRGASGTRDAIVAAAREVFTARGYAGASLRDVARRAGVDPSLVVHYFGAKAGLLAAAVDWEFDLDAARARLLDGPHDGLGDRLARMFLAVWDEAGAAHPVLLLLRVAGTEPRAAELLADLLRQRLLDPLWPAVAHAYGPDAVPDDTAVRSAWLATTLLGVATTRYLVRLPPLADLPAAQIAATLGPALQRHLTPAG